MTTIHLIIAITIGGWVMLYALLLWLMPRLTRRDLYFAVTVAPGFRDEPGSKSILRGYRIELTLVSVLGLVVFVTGVSPTSVLALSSALERSCLCGRPGDPLARDSLKAMRDRLASNFLISRFD